MRPAARVGGVVVKRILITGAGGFIGDALTRRIVALRDSGAMVFDELTLLDRQLPSSTNQAETGIDRIEGDIRDAAVLQAAVSHRPDLVFHLAGITSRMAEQDFRLGMEVNVDAGKRLLEMLHNNGNVPTVVFTSSIGVFGTPLPAHIDDETPQHPMLSYGAAKKMVEVLLADVSRRGWVHGLSIRLPGVVARPLQVGGALSSFASELIRVPAAGGHFTCPVSEQGTMWFLSLEASVTSLLHAATVARSVLPAHRALTLPALRASVSQVVDALVARFGEDLRSRIRYAPDAALEAQFAKWPPLSTELADGLGFRHDGDVATMVARALRAD